MQDGRIQQIGRPRDIYEHPASRFVADFVGTTNFIDGTVVDAGTAGHDAVIRTDLGPMHVASAHDLQPGANAAVSVRPENVELSEAPLDGPNAWTGVVEQKVFLGEAIDFRVTVAGRALLSRQHPTLRTPVGGAITVRIQPDKCVVFPG